MSSPLLAAKTFSLKKHPEYNEVLIRKMIEDHPAMLGLGEVEVKDVERRQQAGGRLDLLLEQSVEDGNRRYEVEIQLGPTDESHIIRTIEYWDNERKRFPQYEHCAVIVAEEITTRFFNVISLFNGSIPIIAIQMNALEVGGQIGLHFIKILDLQNTGVVEETVYVPTDRSYWEEKSTAESLAIVDQACRQLIQEQYPQAQLNYTKRYIGIKQNGIVSNFVVFVPKSRHVQLYINIPQSEEMDKQIDACGLERYAYDKQFGNYRMRLTQKEIKDCKAFLQTLIGMAYKQRFGE